MKIIKLPLLSLFISLFFGVGYAHSTDQTDDLSLDCQQLKHQVATLNARISNTPVGNDRFGDIVLSGLIGNQVKKSNNQNSVTKRVAHLNKLYARKCFKSN